MHTIGPRQPPNRRCGGPNESEPTPRPIGRRRRASGPTAAADREEAARDRAAAEQLQNETAASLELAATDELTGAWTRRFGLEQFTRELARAHRTGSGLVLVFVDVDGLKQINDDHGHLAGDELLALISEVIRAHLRSYDTVVRYGGDEFVCAMPNTGCGPRLRPASTRSPTSCGAQPGALDLVRRRRGGTGRQPPEPDQPRRRGLAGVAGLTRQRLRGADGAA